MNEFALPTNIRQIGSIGDGLRIYMEDYVCTYLFQYAETGGYDERVALLIGRYMVIDGQAILFINGAVQGKHIEEKNGLLQFTEKSGAYADAMISEFFEGMEIVGWMQSQPSYGTYLNQNYAAYHMREFTRDHQVLFVMDPLERLNAFYALNSDRTAMQEIKGYFIYYDKNRNMHEYMLKNKVTDYKTQAPSFIEVTRMEHTEDAEAGRAEAESPAQPEEIIRRHQSERVRKRSHQEQRRTLNLLVSLSAVLFVVCFVMGAGLIQNQDRIAKMEEQLLQLSTAYRNLFVQLNPDGTTSVFAAQFDEASEQAPQTDSTDEPSQSDAAGVIEENGSSLPPAETAKPDEQSSAGSEAGSAEASVPTAAVTTATVSIPETYTIQPGDSLIAISVRFYGDDSRVDDILATNGIVNANRIMAGKTIVLPKP